MKSSAFGFRIPHFAFGIRVFMPNTTAVVETAAPLAREDVTRPSVWRRRANARDLSLYFRQMHALLNAGVSVAAALRFMNERAPNRALQRASVKMSARVGAGSGTPQDASWSQAMRAFPELFAPLTLALIRAGESGGLLSETCLRLAQGFEKTYEVHQEIKRATWYSKLLLIFSTFIVPLPIYLFGGVLSVRAQIAILLGAWLLWKAGSWLWPLSPRAGELRLRLDRLRLKLPVIGKTVRAGALSRFFSVLGALQDAGVSLPSAMQMAAASCGDEVFAQSIKRIIPRVQNGQTLADSLAQTGEIPALALQMVRSGEASGDLNGQLQCVARLLEADAETALKQGVTAFYLFVFLLVAFKIAVQIIQWWCGYAGI